MDLTRFLGRKFDWRTYNCWHFTRDVWLELRGVDMGQYEGTASLRNWIRTFQDNREKIIGPIIRPVLGFPEPCLVLMETNDHSLPHCGVWVNGGLLHLPKQGESCHDIGVIHEMRLFGGAKPRITTFQ